MHADDRAVADQQASFVLHPILATHRLRHGLMISTSHPSKSSTLREARAAPRDRAIAAIWASACDWVVDDLPSDMTTKHGPLVAMPYNAGAIPGGGLRDFTMEHREEAWTLKVMGYIHLTQRYLGAMKEKGAGTIINIIGAAGRSPRYDYLCGARPSRACRAYRHGHHPGSPLLLERYDGLISYLVAANPCGQQQQAYKEIPCGVAAASCNPGGCRCRALTIKADLSWLDY